MRRPGWPSRLTSSGAAPRPKTKYGYRNALDNHILPAFDDLLLDEIPTAAVRTWRGRFAVKSNDSAGDEAYGGLKTILQTAEDDGVITATPADSQAPAMP